MNLVQLLWITIAAESVVISALLGYLSLLHKEAVVSTQASSIDYTNDAE